jgi:trehalose 6-phosphate phosphatase
MKHLLSSWPEIAKRLHGAKSILLFADYDGTLTPIVDRPEDAVIPDNTKKVLRALSVLPGFTVGIISGRSLADVMERVDLISVVYAGNHGMEIKELSGLLYVDPEVKKAQPIIDGIYKKLVKKLGRIKGVLVENKGLSLSIHYRLVDEDMMQKVRTIFDNTVKEAKESGDVRVTHGKKVFEVRPAVDIDKGMAIRKLFGKHINESAAGGGKLVPIYIGDDRTDEDGFKAIEEYGKGISIFVGAPQAQSAASYFLNSSDEVAEFLSMLYEQVQKGLAK